MRVECPWHRQATKSEARVHEVVAGCLEQAYVLDPLLAYPCAEWRKVLGYLEDPVRLRQLEAKAPRDCETPVIGFRRRLMRQALAGDWSVALPGYFYCEVEQEPEATVYWFDDLRLRAHALKSQTDDGSPLPAQGILPSPDGAAGDVFVLEGDGTLGWGQVTRDANWAVATWRSIRHECQEEAAGERPS